MILASVVIGAVLEFHYFWYYRLSSRGIYYTCIGAYNSLGSSSYPGEFLLYWLRNGSTKVARC